MSQLYRRPVIAAFDTSPNAALALNLAASEAAAAGVSLLVVHAYPWPILYASLANVSYTADDWTPSPQTTHLVEAAAARVRTLHPGLPVTVSVRAGSGRDVLVAASGEASLLVLGRRGSGGLGGALSGSVLSGVMAHAQCPVLVARGRQPDLTTGGEVCVGVDGSPSSLGALRFAAVWAAQRGSALTAIHAVNADALDEPAPELGVLTPAQERLLGWITDLTGLGVRIDPVVVRRGATDALLAASRTARLLVVGSRHRGELRSVTLGSVAHALVRRSACPVTVVHGWGAVRRNSTAAERG